MTGYAMDPAVRQSWVIENENQLADWAAEFVPHIQAPMTLLLDGPMGSGKTTLVRHLMRVLHGEEASSPTFSLVNEYRGDRGVVYHFDLYRLEQAEELEEIGFEEYLDSPTVCVIEWPQLGVDFYDPEISCTIRIEILADTRRRITWYKGIAI